MDPRSVLGSGDVKYHMGATGEYITRSGAKMQIHLVSNPSHLEAVDPVTMGRTRAKHDRAGGRAAKISAFAGARGRGVRRARHFCRDLELCRHSRLHRGRNRARHRQQLDRLHHAPRELHSSRFAAQLARRQDIPIFHVNAEDVDAVMRVGRIALEYRYTFRHATWSWT